MARNLSGMPRQPRYFYPGIVVHVVQRGNDRAPVFVSPDDRQYYLAYWSEAARVHDVAIHAYVLMGNHVHLLLSPSRNDSLPRAVQAVGRRYVRRFNTVHGRTGTLWEGRYRATAVESEQYLFVCMRYIELNPVRAGIVKHPLEYPWSSAHANAIGKRDPLVKPHPLFAAIGNSIDERQRAYLPGLTAPIESEALSAIRDATNFEWALGGSAFCAGIGITGGRRGTRIPKGRPARP